MLRWYPTIPFVSSQSQMKSELAAVASEFGRLTRFLAEEQEGLERRLRETHEAQLGRAGAVASRLSEQAAQLSRLLAEAQERSQQGGLRLLQVSSVPFPMCPTAPFAVRHCLQHLSRVVSSHWEEATVIQPDPTVIQPEDLKVF